MLDVLADALLDTLKMLPFLFLAYLLIEYLEHKANDKMERALSRFGLFGSIGGAILGCVPQCGFSVAAANLYATRIITVGTLISVFIATSDEAIPIILAHPENISSLWQILVIKIIIAVISGLIIDLFVRFVLKKETHTDYHGVCEHCDCEHHGIFYSALKHTVSITAFVLIINLILGYIIYFIGESSFARIMLADSVFQPFLTALIGFIPNCAASVILTECFVDGSVTMGSLVAGLTTGAGLGIAVLFKANRRRKKENFLILVILYTVAVLSGIIINALPI